MLEPCIPESLTEEGFSGAVCHLKEAVELVRSRKGDEGSVQEFCPESVKGLPCPALCHWCLPGKTEGHGSLQGDGGQDLWSVLLLPPKEKMAKLVLTRVAWAQTQWRFHGDTDMQAGGVASAQCPLGESEVTCQGEANHRTAHRAKSASSDRSGFFRFEVFAAGAGASVGGEGRSGTVSAALARSSRNLSNSAIQTKLWTGLAGVA